MSISRDKARWATRKCDEIAEERRRVRVNLFPDSIQLVGCRVPGRKSISDR